MDSADSGELAYRGAAVKVADEKEPYPLPAGTHRLCFSVF
jgi:hypothetical protein